MEVALFYLIGMGWKITRGRLRPAEQAFIGTVGSTSLCLGLSEVGCNVFRHGNGQSYLLMQFTLHTMCFLVVIIAVNFNIFTLQRQIAEALAQPDTGALYAKHHAYHWFRVCFIYFVVIPSVTNFLSMHIVSWRALWVTVLAREGSLWFVYTVLIWLFRPGFKYIRVFELAVV